MGSTGDPPVPFGDPPNEIAKGTITKRPAPLVRNVIPVPVGGSPTGTGESPVLPEAIF